MMSLFHLLDFTGEDFASILHSSKCDVHSQNFIGTLKTNRQQNSTTKLLCEKTKNSHVNFTKWQVTVIGHFIPDVQRSLHQSKACIYISVDRHVTIKNNGVVHWMNSCSLLLTIRWQKYLIGETRVNGSNRAFKCSLDVNCQRTDGKRHRGLVAARLSTIRQMSECESDLGCKKIK